LDLGLRGELRQTEVGNSCHSLKTAGERVGFWFGMTTAEEAEVGSAGEQPAKEYSA